MTLTAELGRSKASGVSVFLDPEQTISPCSTQLCSGPHLHLGCVEGGDPLFCVQQGLWSIQPPSYAL